MILKALYDYYHRCGDLAPEGLEYKEIAFLVVIDQNGNFIRLEDRRIDAKRISKFLVLKGTRSGKTPKPYIFWDNVEYILNYTKFHPELSEEESEKADVVEKRNKAIADATKKNRCLIDKYQEISKMFPANDWFKAVCLFYEKGEIEKIKESPLWTEISKKPTVNISFLIEGETEIVAENEDLKSLVSKNKEIEETTSKHVCLITGKYDIPIESTTPTPIPGAQATARLVSFQVNSGYDSYGKSKGLNAGMSKEAEASYTTALNRLLDKDSKNKFLVGNRTFLFWASKQDEISKQAEEGLFSLFGFKSKEDDPNRNIESVRKVFNSVYSGALHTDDKDKFYFLGLAPNSARIAVVYWSESNIRDFALNILEHFAGMDLADTREPKRSYYGLYEIMKAVSLKGDVSKVTPNLPETVFKSIIQGSPYPASLLMACINRIRAEQEITIGRAGIIKAYLNRLNNTHKKLNTMVDKENPNEGYLCGRLFATLEKIQEEGNGSSNIRSRYMNSASGTPGAVFPTILNLSVHHSDKLNKGRQIYFEQIKSEIVDKLPSAGFSAHLDLQDQGRFMVGYYHQRQEFFTKRDKVENTENEETNIEE